MKGFVTAAAILLLTASTYAHAQAQSGKPAGASELSPGDIKNDAHAKPQRGASELSPGDQMRDRTTKMRGGASTTRRRCCPAATRLARSGRSARMRCRAPVIRQFTG